LGWDDVEFYGYKKISLEEILHIAEENGGELKFMFARQIAPSNIETILSLLYIKKTIDEYGYKVNEVILDTLQWKDDKFSFRNEEKRIFVRPQILYSESQYPIAVKSMTELKSRDKYRIGDIYLDVNKISEMIKETGLEYMDESLNHLGNERKITEIKEGEEIKVAVDILDFWGLTTLYYIGEVSKHIFEINNYKIEEFKDKIKLVNGDKFDIYGYESTFKYKEKELKFRIYDASHIFGEEAKKYGIEKNGYMALAVLSGSGYILLEGDPEKLDQKIREFIRKAKDKTGYDILLLLVDEQPLIERGIIGKEDYVKLIGKDKIKKFIDTISKTYGI
jgi:hypothetical protein